ICASLLAGGVFLLFMAPAPSEIYPLSLHDALPIWKSRYLRLCAASSTFGGAGGVSRRMNSLTGMLEMTWAASRRCVQPCCETTRSEEHTSELQSRENLVCRLLLEKKKQNTETSTDP